MSSSISANLTVSVFLILLKQNKDCILFASHSKGNYLNLSLSNTPNSLSINVPIVTVLLRFGEAVREVYEKKNLSNFNKNHLSFPTLTKQDGLHVVKVRNCL